MCCCCCFALFICGGAFCKSNYMVFVVCSGMCSIFHVLVSIVLLSKPLNPITIGQKSKCASSVFHFDSFAFTAAFVTSSMPFRFTIVSVFVRCCFCIVCGSSSSEQERKFKTKTLTPLENNAKFKNNNNKCRALVIYLHNCINVEKSINYIEHS